MRKAQVTNQSGDDATTPQAAVAKVWMLMERLKAGASLRDLAVGYSEDPNRRRAAATSASCRVEPQEGAAAIARCGLGKRLDRRTWRARRRVTLVLVVAHEQAGSATCRRRP